MDCRPQQGNDNRAPPATLYERLERLKQRLGRTVGRLGCNPTAFAFAEILGFCALLGLIYYIDVHRGPVLESDDTRRERETSRERDLRIRREVAGYSDEPRHHLRRPLVKPPAELPVSDCEECARNCTANPGCVAYDCDPEQPACRMEMKPPEPAPSKCSGVEIDLIEGGHVKSTRRINYHCDTDGTGKESGWTLWGAPSRHPGFTAALILIVMFYALVAWFFVYARHDDPGATIGDDDRPFTFGNVLGKATVMLLGVAAGTALIAVGLTLIGELIKLIGSWLPHKKAASASARAAGTDSMMVILNFAITVAGVGLLYLALKPLIDQNTRGHYLSLIKNLILYLPCLLIALAKTIAKEWKIAPYSAWVLLGLEVLFVGLRLLVPWASSALMNHDGRQLLDKPVYLDIERSVGTFEMLHLHNNSKKPEFSYSYGLSAWFTLNPQPPNTRPAFMKYTTILNYGSKPRISFNMDQDTLRVESESGEGKVTVAEVTGVALQTWNNIVINYDAGTMDVFLNGELIGSHPGISPFMQFEEVKVGRTRGLEGGICNVMYFPQPLSKRRITMAYKLLRDRFPPTSD